MSVCTPRICLCRHESLSSQSMESMESAGEVLHETLVIHVVVFVLKPHQVRLKTGVWKCLTWASGPLSHVSGLQFFSLLTISNSSSAFIQTCCFVFEGEMLGHSLLLSLLFIFTCLLSYYYSFQYSFAYLARLIQSAASNLDQQWTCPDGIWFVWMLNLSQQVCVMIRGQSGHHAALTARVQASARSGRVRAS